MSLLRRTALLAALAAPACGPVAEPIIAPIPTGAALDTAPRPFVRPVVPSDAFQEAVRSGTRTTTGAPGPAYWQQRVRYDMDARLDPSSRRVDGAQRIVYHNQSPDSLPYVVVHLYQNLFTDAFTGERSPFNTGGFTLTRVVAQGEELGEVTRQQHEANLRAGRRTVGYMVEGTLARVMLPRTIAARDSARFEIDWHFLVPPRGAPRTGYEDALGGRAFQVSKWYPQIAVYDDVQGWDVAPYRGQGEFYQDYAEFDVSVTVPAGWLVGATGTLQNPEAVLAPDVLDRLRIAAASDTMIRVVPRGQVAAGTTSGVEGQVTWRFQASDVRDFGFATSNRYLWEAGRIRVPDALGGTRDVVIHSMYRPGATHWEQSWDFGRHSTDFFSRLLVPYPYPQLTIAEGPVYGMEFPMVLFIGRPGEQLALYEVIAHEVGHQWFPMLVGQDEAAYAWMDEGITTYIEALAVQDRFPREDAFEAPRQAYLNIAGRREEEPMMRHADMMPPQAFAIAGYFKPATVLRSLQRVVGDAEMVEALRTYATEWSFRKPQPWDFFNTVERVAGQELDWFFYPWFFRTVTHDLAIGEVQPLDGRVRVEVRDVGQIPAPAIVVATNRAGETFTATIPIEDWLSPSRRVQTVEIPVTGEVVRVEIDPERWFADVNRRNNVWTP